MTRLPVGLINRDIKLESQHIISTLDSTVSFITHPGMPRGNGATRKCVRNANREQHAVPTSKVAKTIGLI